MTTREWEIAHYLKKLSEESHCLDKQVACAIVDSRGRIVASGVNEIVRCDKNCSDKERRTCVVTHAEVVTARRLNLSDRDLSPLTAYVTLFPCVPCQKFLTAYGVTEIVAFGPQHKEQWFPNIRLERDLWADMLENNGEEKQISVAQGELAEAITEISDFFWRPLKGRTTRDLADEVADAELMLDQIKRLAWRRDPDAYNVLREVRVAKLASLADRLRRGAL